MSKCYCCNQDKETHAVPITKDESMEVCTECLPYMHTAVERLLKKIMYAQKVREIAFRRSAHA